MQPDETDWKIIEILRKGNQTNSEIARRLGVSEGMVRQRLKQLKEAGILQVRALINPDALDNKELAVIGVNVAETNLLQKKAEELAALPEVLSVSVITGRFDLLVEILVHSNHGMVEFLTGALADVEGINKTESFIFLKSFNKFV